MFLPGSVKQRQLTVVKYVQEFAKRMVFLSAAFDDGLGVMMRERAACAEQSEKRNRQFGPRFHWYPCSELIGGETCV